LVKGGNGAVLLLQIGLAGREVCRIVRDSIARPTRLAIEDWSLPIAVHRRQTVVEGAGRNDHCGMGIVGKSNAVTLEHEHLVRITQGNCRDPWNSVESAYEVA